MQAPGSAVLRGLELLRASGRRGCLLAAVFAAQFLIPLLALVASDPPTKLGFQMYSGVGAVSAELMDDAGILHKAKLDEVTGAARPDIDWTTRLPARLCATTPWAVEARVRQALPGKDRTSTLACPR